MPTDTTAMITIKMALTIRLSLLCRKRIMDRLEPSTLYAPAMGESERADGKKTARRVSLPCTNSARQAQISLDATLPL
jgi:hypothetical protein